MDYKELIKEWESEKLIRFDVNDLSGKGLKEETIFLLSVVGLPTSAAPFLTFAEDSEKAIDSILNTYERGDSKHRYFLGIGSDGAVTLFA